jgi:Flp pilus assembly protein TadD
MMRNNGLRALLLAASLAGSAAIACADAGFRIKLPKGSKPTPVQQLNREGVKAAKKRQLEKAENLFYRAYLLDPDDPFTLHNLGYVSELGGKIDRAERYYQLASQHGSETIIADSTVSDLKGQQLTKALNFVGDEQLRVNRGNIEAMSLLRQGRTQEAEQILNRILALDQRNPFTLNNLGYTMEQEGNLDAALRYYTEAANLHSSQSIVVAFDPHWRGKAISDIAQANAGALSRRMQAERTDTARAARLNLEGVFALNHNDAQQARRDFLEAYHLDPWSPFSLNNMGYISEMNGDQETADEFYSSAREAPGSVQKVTAASHSEMNGMTLGEVAGDNSRNTEANLQVMQEARRRQGGPIVLKRRDNTPISEPEASQPSVVPLPDQNQSVPQVAPPPGEQLPLPHTAPPTPQP